MTARKIIIHKTVFSALTIYGLMLFILTIPVSAKASSIAQGFVTNDKNLTVGMAASLSGDSNTDTQNIIPASTINASKFVGIVTTNNANLLTLTNNTATVVVATSGDAKPLVTDVNGVVKKGDKLSVSPLSGLLMKAEDGGAGSIGTALEDANTDKATKQQIDTRSGAKKQVLVSTVQVVISTQNISGTENKNKNFLNTIGENLSGKKISDWQAIIALIVFLLLIVVEGSLIYGAVHSSFLALGRNPMAHDLVYRQLAQVILAVLAVLAFGIATIYTVLQI